MTMTILYLLIKLNIGNVLIKILIILKYIIKRNLVYVIQKILNIAFTSLQDISIKNIYFTHSFAHVSNVKRDLKMYKFL